MSLHSIPVHKEVLENIPGFNEGIACKPLSGGLINHSFKITYKGSCRSILLQHINKKVFPYPAILQSNYLQLWNYLKLNHQLYRMPEPLSFVDGKKLFNDARGECWRIFEFIEGSVSSLHAATAVQAREVAETFARFTATFGSFDINLLRETISGFHNLNNRFSQFITACKKCTSSRLAESKEIIRSLEERERYVSYYNYFRNSGNFPLRVMHHDAKIANILFDSKTGSVICPVDFDTTMPGYFFSDPGDMIRSMVCSLDESNPEISLISVQEELYEAITEGYLSEIKILLTPAEIKYFHYAGLLIIFMQALRFVTDYLNGDIYYQTSYARHNYDRAMNQLTLLMRLEEFLSARNKLPPVLPV